MSKTTSKTWTKAKILNFGTDFCLFWNIFLIHGELLNSTNDFRILLFTKMKLMMQQWFEMISWRIEYVENLEVVYIVHVFLVLGGTIKKSTFDPYFNSKVLNFVCDVKSGFAKPELKNGNERVFSLTVMT